MLVVVILTIASFGCWIAGSGTLSTLTSCLPCHVTAFILPSLLARRLPAAIQSRLEHVWNYGRRPVRPTAERFLRASVLRKLMSYSDWYPASGQANHVHLLSDENGPNCVPSGSPPTSAEDRKPGRGSKEYATRVLRVPGPANAGYLHTIASAKLTVGFYATG